MGCKIVNGEATYKLHPVTDYAAEPGKLGCHEDFADSATWYITRPCDLLAGGIGEVKYPDAGKARYKYFKNSVFDGREYLPPGGCH